MAATDSDLLDDKLCERNSLRFGAEMSAAVFNDLNLHVLKVKLIYCKLCSLW